jgi:hypothetical protein
MKRQLILGTITLLAGSLFAADAKDDVINAAKKLAGAGGYAWKSTIEMAGGGGGGGGGGMRPGPTEGKIGKDGMVMLSMTRGDNTTEAVVMGTKGAIKTADGWQSLAEATEGGGGGGQGNPGRFMARRLQTFKAPAAEVEEMAGKTTGLKKVDDAFVGDLTEEAAKGLLTFGPGRGGGDGPSVSNAKGSVKIWVKEGVVAKYEVKVQGTVSFNGNDRDIDRITKVEIKDVGTAKVEVPEDAKKKLQ